MSRILYLKTWPTPKIKKGTILGELCRNWKAPTNCNYPWWTAHHLQGVTLWPSEQGNTKVFSPKNYPSCNDSDGDLFIMFESILGYQDKTCISQEYKCL